jgi:hypothetical protein
MICECCPYEWAVLRKVAKLSACSARLPASNRGPAAAAAVVAGNCTRHCHILPESIDTAGRQCNKDGMVRYY